MRLGALLFLSPSLLLLGATLLILIYAYWPSLFAQFAIIDDHDIVYKLGPTLNWDLQSLWSQIRVEALTPVAGQFIPLYFIPHYVEVYLFGHHPETWHALRILMAVITGGFIFFALRLLLPALAAAICTLYFFCGLHGLSVWIGLCLSETYGHFLFAPGFFLLLYSILKAPNRKKSELAQLGLILIALTGWIKTSLVPLFPATYFFVYFLLPKLGIYPKPDEPLGKRHAPVTVLLLLNFLLQVAVAILLVYSGTNQWVESNMGQRWLSVNPASLTVFKSFAPPLALITLCYLVWVLVEKGPNRKTAFLLFGLVVISQFVLWFLPQWVVYGKTMGLQRRYSTPANFFPYFTFILTFLLIGKGKLGRQIFQPLILGFMVLYLAFWIERMNVRSKFFTETTHRLQTELATLISLKTESPEKEFVFCTNLWNREPLTSIYHYLSTYLNTEEKVHLKLDKTDGWRQSPFLTVSATLLMAKAKHGDWKYHPESKLPRDPSSVIAVYFSGTEENCPYPTQVRITDLFQ